MAETVPGDVKEVTVNYREPDGYSPGAIFVTGDVQRTEAPHVKMLLSALAQVAGVISPVPDVDGARIRVCIEDDTWGRIGFELSLDAGTMVPGEVTFSGSSVATAISRVDRFPLPLHQ